MPARRDHPRDEHRGEHRPAPPDAGMREAGQVTPLELFFDLVFVLALTQCTALMADEPDLGGAGEGAARARRAVVVVGRLRLADERRRPRGGRRAARDLRRDGGAARRRALRAGGVRRGGADLRARLRRRADRAHRAVHARQPRRAEPAPVGHRPRRSPRRSPAGCWSAPRSPTARCRAALWALALALDIAGPYFFGAEGWKLAPHHFSRASRADPHHRARRVDRRDRRRRRGRRSTSAIVVAAVVGIGIAAALWWLYFDVVALVAARRLADAEVGREQNEMARDSYSILHFPMVAGIVLVALGMKKTLGHVEDPLKLVPAAALLGGIGDVPARPRRLPLPPHPHVQHPPPRRSRSCSSRSSRWPSRSRRSSRSACSPPALALLIVVETHAYGESRHRTRERAAPRGIATAGRAISPFARPEA